MAPWWIALLIGCCMTLGCLGIALWVRMSVKRHRRHALQQQLWQLGQKRPRVTFALLFQRAGYQGSPLRLYLIMGQLALMGFAIGSSLHLFPLFSLAIGAAAGLAAPHMYLRVKFQKRQLAFLEQLPSALELMANGLRAGLGINSACEVIAREMKDPVGREFSQMVGELQLGSSVEAALDRLTERNPSGDVRLLAQAILLHKQVGGNLAEVLDNLDHTIRERFWLHREIKSTTAEQRLSAIVLAALPLFIAAAMYVLNRTYILTMVTTEIGHYFLAAAIVLWIVGFVWLKQILHIEF